MTIGPQLPEIAKIGEAAFRSLSDGCHVTEGLQQAASLPLCSRGKGDSVGQSGSESGLQSNSDSSLPVAYGV